MSEQVMPQEGGSLPPVEPSAEDTPSKAQPSAEDIPSKAEPSAEDMAAHDYQKLLPLFLNKIGNFSKAKLRRVIKAVVEYPLEQQKPQFAYEEEQQAFYLGAQILDCRHVLMNHVIKLIQERKTLHEKTLAEEKAKQVPSNDAMEVNENKEENNGN